MGYMQCHKEWLYQWRMFLHKHICSWFAVGATTDLEIRSYVMKQARQHEHIFQLVFHISRARRF